MKHATKVQYTIVNTFPHPLPAFTQGFEYNDGVLLESLGLHGSSRLRKINLTGEILSEISIPSEYFAEGCTQLNGKIYQLTWKNNIGFVYDLNFKTLGQFRYAGEGWGLTNDGTHLIMSNGTGTIQYLHPETFAVVKSIHMSNLSNLNSLAYIEKTIYANIWQTNLIVCINPERGLVLEYIDLTNLYPESSGENVLNGIAYDAVKKRLFVTGKNWPSIYEITIRPSGKPGRPGSPVGRVGSVRCTIL